MQQHKILLDKGISLKPGEKLCNNCRKILYCTDVNEIIDTESYVPQEETVENANVIEQLNNSLTEVGCSSLKLHSLPER